VSEISLPDAVEIALEQLGKDGGVVIGGNSATNNLRWANSALTTNGDSVDQTLSISAFVSVAGGVATGMSSGQIRSRADVEAFHRIRRRGEPGIRISAASWNRSIAAIDKLYCERIISELFHLTKRKIAA
jgi:hypothetical protein